MGHHTCCNQQKVKRGLWSPEEDEKLTRYITTHGYGCWSEVPEKAGLQRCGKSCRLRWINYLRPDIRRGRFTPEEEKLIISLHEAVGNRWAHIASHLPGRTDNEIKNYWNSWIKKKIRKPSSSTSTTANDSDQTCSQFAFITSTQSNCFLNHHQELFTAKYSHQLRQDTLFSTPSSLFMFDTAGSSIEGLSSDDGVDRTTQIFKETTSSSSSDDIWAINQLHTQPMSSFTNGTDCNYLPPLESIENVGPVELQSGDLTLNSLQKMELNEWMGTTHQNSSSYIFWDQLQKEEQVVIGGKEYGSAQLIKHGN